MAAVERRLGELDRRSSRRPSRRYAATATPRADGRRSSPRSVAPTAEAAAVADLADGGARSPPAVALPGVVLAATGRDDERARPPTSATPVALAGAVAPLVDGDDEVADSMVLSRYDRLSEALAGGYDTAIDEVDGVKVVHVDDDTGRQPLAAVAARLADEAEAAQGRLAAREREVLERFLLRELADEVRAQAARRPRPGRRARTARWPACARRTARAPTSTGSCATTPPAPAAVGGPAARRRAARRGRRRRSCATRCWR